MIWDHRIFLKIFFKSSSASLVAFPWLPWHGQNKPTNHPLSLPISGLRSGEITPTPPSRPLSSLSQQSTGSGSVQLRTRPPQATPRRPRPASIAVTGVTEGPAPRLSEQLTTLPDLPFLQPPQCTACFFSSLWFFSLFPGRIFNLYKYIYKSFFLFHCQWNRYKKNISIKIYPKKRWCTIIILNLFCSFHFLIPQKINFYI